MFYTIMKLLSYALAVLFVIGMIKPSLILPLSAFRKIDPDIARPSRLNVLQWTVMGAAIIFCMMGIGTIWSVLVAKQELAERMSNQTRSERLTAKRELIQRLAMLIDAEMRAAKIVHCGEYVANDITVLRALNNNINKLDDNSVDEVTKQSYILSISSVYAKLSQVKGCVQ